MDNTNQTKEVAPIPTPISAYLKKHWFQILMIGFALFIFTKRDFSFEFNMNNPNKTEQQGEPSSSNTKSKKKQIITQKKDAETVTKANAGFLDRFNIPFIGSGSTSSKAEPELSAIDEKVIESYLKRFAQVAISERKKYGVPSSIILANALYHGFAGKRDMAQQGNNHFAIKCEGDWQGESGTYHEDCYRHYENAWTSFRDHSLYVTSGKFAHLRQLESTDYKSWARELEKADFSEFPKLEKNLIEIIEKYGLHQLDFQ